MKTLNINNHPTFFNLMNTNEVCETKTVFVDDECLYDIIYNAQCELMKIKDTEIRVIDSVTHPHLSKLWDLFYNNKFTNITLYNYDCDDYEDFNSLVDRALSEVCNFYV